MKRINLIIALGISLALPRLVLAQAVTVTGEGNVGIGLTDPTHKLVVDGGNVRVAGQNRLTFGGAFSQEYIYNPNGVSLRIHVGNDDRIHISNAGNVGIGTTGPFSRFHVHSEGISRQDLSTASTSEPVFQRFFHSENIQGGAVGFDTNDGVLKLIHGGNFDTSTSGLMISESGNVGIGGLPVAARLGIDGNLQFSPGGRRTIKFLDPLRSLFIGANPAEAERGPHAIHLVTDDGTGSTERISIVGDAGHVGIGKASPNFPLEMGSGAHVTTGGVWVDASSRQLKEGITNLPLEDAIAALDGLQPVTFSYKAEPRESYVGFIAEDVPDLVATGDRKSLSPMDIVAVLTRVVQHQQQQIADLKARLDASH